SPSNGLARLLAHRRAWRRADTVHALGARNTRGLARAAARFAVLRGRDAHGVDAVRTAPTNDDRARLVRARLTYLADLDRGAFHARGVAVQTLDRPAHRVARCARIAEPGRFSAHAAVAHQIVRTLRNVRARLTGLAELSTRAVQANGPQRAGSGSVA